MGGGGGGVKGELRSRLYRKPSIQRMFKQVQIKIVEMCSPLIESWGVRIGGQKRTRRSLAK